MILYHELDSLQSYYVIRFIIRHSIIDLIFLRKGVQISCFITDNGIKSIFDAYFLFRLLR